MRIPVLLIAALTIFVASPALAQSSQGRWECHGAAPADPTQIAPHGLLAIFGQSYSYASSVYQDPASGDGDVEQQESGIAFLNGPLQEKAGVETGQVNLGAGPLAMDLVGAQGVVLSCLAM